MKETGKFGKMDAKSGKKGAASKGSGYGAAVPAGGKKGGKGKMPMKGSKNQM